GKTNSDLALAWHRQQAANYFATGYWYGALFHLRPVLDAWPNRRDLHRERASAFAALGQWQKASEDYALAFDEKGKNPEYWLTALALLLLAGDTAGYHQARRTLLDRYQHTTDARVAYLLARGYALGITESCRESISAVDQQMQVLSLAQRAVK